MVTTLLLLVSLAAKPTTAPIDAASRDAFDHWVDYQVGLLFAFQKEGRAEEAVAIAKGLDEADVDWKSFAVRGRENFDFPKMLFYNEFYKGPLDALHPGRVFGKLTGKERPAVNARTDGSVPHSSFYTNVAIPTYTPEQLHEKFLEYLPAGNLTITKVKKDGTSEGLWAKDELGRTYILIFDSPFAPEMTTSAEYIGSTLVRLLGYHVPKTCICSVRGTGNPMYDGRRAVATIALDDFKGGWLYASFRDRREIRALQVVGGWISNVDQTEQNTGVTISDAGVHRHYVLDFGSSLGSFTFRPQLARLGWTRLFDPYQQYTQKLYDHGIRKVRWEAPYSVQSAAVGYFTANYDPDRWQPFYTNRGFTDVTESDRVWAAEKIAQVTDEQIRTVVHLAGYSHPEDAEHIIRTLIKRRDLIVERYLSR